jgi:phosphoglycerate dehydrogenase-like enzyme
MTRLRCAILDDYFDIATEIADWPRIADRVEVTAFTEPFPSTEAAASALKDFEIICAMRERTAFPRQLIEALPKLKLLITSGLKNAAFDMEAAKERGIVVCGTQWKQDPTAPLTMGLILELTRGIGRENARMHAGEPWQKFCGVEIEGKTLGIVGLGKLGSKIASLGKAFGMNVIAWSPNLTPERCKEVGVGYATKEPSAYLVNTSRGPIVDEAALLDILQQRKIAGAGIDVFSIEPLPVDHPFRKLDNMVVTPHLGYVSRDAFEAHYSQMVENIEAWLKGEPMRKIS